MMKRLLTAMGMLCALCAPFAAASAQTAQEYFKLGNSAYNRADYPAALENYLEAAKKGGGSAELFYNTANACAKVGKLSLAELYYLRAIYANPRLREASANLETLAKDGALEIPQMGIAQTALAELSEGEWTALALAAFWGTVLLIAIPPLYGKRSAALAFLAIVCAITMCVSVAGIFNWRAFANRAVAVGEAPSLRISPAPEAPVCAILADGQLAKIRKSRGDFLYLETSNGKRGWGNKSDFEPIGK